MGKILLFYTYTDFQYPTRILKWQRQICSNLGLTGRIIIAHEGINGTVGGSEKACERYIEIMRKHPQLKDVDFKESPGGAECFPRMRIVVKDEIVHLGTQDAAHIQNTGEHLTPEQTHQLLEKKPKDLVILDARNTCETEIGAFQGAIKPKLKHFRELPKYIDEHIDTFKDKEVLMYCTGGIRCERATAYLNEKKVAKKVYQIEGGIHRYAEKFPDGFFRGKNYVFDGRIATKITDDVLGRCLLCNTSCDDYTNCYNVLCNKHHISCQSCMKAYENCCSTTCKDLIASGKTKRRKPLHKVDVSQCSL